MQQVCATHFQLCRSRSLVWGSSSNYALTNSVLPAASKHDLARDLNCHFKYIPLSLKVRWDERERHSSAPGVGTSDTPVPIVYPLLCYTVGKTQLPMKRRGWRQLSIGWKNLPANNICKAGFYNNINHLTSPWLILSLIRGPSAWISRSKSISCTRKIYTRVILLLSNHI